MAKDRVIKRYKKAIKTDGKLAGIEIERQKAEAEAYFEKMQPLNGQN